MFKMALFCGGPSAERGISLNSARSVLDHLSRDGLDIIPLYIAHDLTAYRLSPAQLYSNTPSDFDFKLHDAAEHLSPAALLTLLKTVDLVFPAIHGTYGEDGTLQAWLDEHAIPYVGSNAATCRLMFDKHTANQQLVHFGFHTQPFELVTRDNAATIIPDFFIEHRLTRAVIKPVAGGSSIGVHSVTTPEQAIDAALQIFDRAHDNAALLEPFCDGREFTVVVIQNENGAPVALLPTEIDTSYANNQFFDFRRKYLPTNQVSYHCPPRFADDVTATIRSQAEQLFQHFGMRDFARLDGWLMPNGHIRFADFNPISGMEQNSFLFQQGARIGLSHADMLHHIVQTACRRYGKKFPAKETTNNAARQPVRVLCGGNTAERQVSLMSGTNIWLKLRDSQHYSATPYLLENENRVWHLPYAYTLNHTVEEILANCQNAASGQPRLQMLIDNVRAALNFPAWHSPLPTALSLGEFCQQAATENAFVFLGLHGGMGEDGRMQTLLDSYGVAYNGSGAAASALCMDKFQTGQAIGHAGLPHIITAPKRSIAIESFYTFSAADYAAYWQTLCAEFQTQSFIIKPQSDGCSAGIIRLYSADDLQTYVTLCQTRALFIPPHTFPQQPSIIEMGNQPDAFLLESYIQTDPIRIDGHTLHHTPRDGWIELTVGVLEQNNMYHSLSPSITVAEGAVLSLEEKFQGGTGTNLTPPPPSICTPTHIAHIKTAIEKTAAILGIHNYARIDIFFNLNTHTTLIIEANTLPGLTPSTVIYHQGLNETPSLAPRAFLEHIIGLKLNNVQLQPAIAA